MYRGICACKERRLCYHIPVGLGDNKEEMTSAGFTPLHFAAAAQDVARLQKLLESGAADVNVYSDSGVLPVHCVFLGPKLYRKSGLIDALAEDADKGPIEVDDYVTDDVTSSKDDKVTSEKTEADGTDSSSQSSTDDEADSSKNNKPPKHKEVLEILIKHGADINATTRCGCRITTYREFWASSIHEWIITQPILLPNFTQLVEQAAVNYRYSRDNMHHYLRAGCRDLLAVHSVAALAVLAGNHKSHFLTAYYSDPMEVNRMDMGFLFDDRFWDCREKLEPCISYFIGFIYRVCGDGVPWIESEAQLEKNDPEHKKNFYWIHKENQRTVLMLKFICCVKIRHTLVEGTKGHSIFPAIDKLPIPQKLKEMLQINLKYRSFKT